MQKVLLALFILVNVWTVKAQESCEEVMTCKVTAPSGMNMRSKPSLQSSVVVSVPHDSTLIACRETFGAMQYEKISGFWRRVSYKGKKGYMFDGFLEITSLGEASKNEETENVASDTTASTEETGVAKKPVDDKPKRASYNLLTEAYNYCGDVRSIDPGLLWYGVYPRDEDGGIYYRIKPVDVDIVLSKQKVGEQLEFDIQTAEEERSIFLIGLDQKLNVDNLRGIEDNSDELRRKNRKVFPGQEWILGKGERKNIVLSATGSVESSGDGPCPDLKNYKLLLKGEKYYMPVEQNITEELSGSGQCGMPEIYWYGDLTNDGIPEIIFVSVYEEKNQFTLFVSDPYQDNVLVKKEAEWVIDKCY